MEIGDGTSEEHGFSWQDIAADVAGAVFGYFHEASPWFGRTFDFRWEYVPPLDDLGDPFTGYEHSAYVLAANVGALVPRRHPRVLDFLDLQVGYQVRDLDAGPTGRRQELLLGVGLNAANILRHLGVRGVATFFEYYQIPWISLRFAIDVS